MIRLKKIKYLALIVLLSFSSAELFSQKKNFFHKIHQNLSFDIGYKFNNDFKIYYKDLKPFYYSGATFALQYKFFRSEIIAGIRYMPFLSAVKPELGFNYYPDHNPESKFNYFIHTTAFYNSYSYNTKVGYENYSYHWKGIVPADYSSVKFQSFVHDIGFGIKMGFNHHISADFIFTGGYFYGRRDFVEGAELKKHITQTQYWGFTYGARFSLKFLLGHKAPDEDDK